MPLFNGVYVQNCTLTKLGSAHLVQQSNLQSYTDTMRKIVVAITGASGSFYGVRLLVRLKSAGCETHLVASPAGV